MRQCLLESRPPKIIDATLCVNCYWGLDPSKKLTQPYASIPMPV